MEKSLHMVGGASEFSYAANSKIQGKGIVRIRPMLEEAVGEVHKNLLHNSMVVADLGCSSGPNTFLVIFEVMKIVSERCQRLGMQPPAMQFFLNDLPGNDFNNIFQSLDSFEKRVAADKSLISIPHYVMGLPGSFYGRLFPCQTVHFFHSSYSLNWLSQVPEGLENKGEKVPLNKGNTHIGRTSPPLVAKLYQEQFIKDFSQFLKMRFDELVPGGQLVTTLRGRKNEDIYSTGELMSLWELLSQILSSMVIEGLVEEEKLDSFHIPIYTPFKEEIKAIINAEELFDILHIQIFESNWEQDINDDSDDDHFVLDNIQRGKISAMCMRAALEPIIARHFGGSIVDELFSRFAIKMTKHLANGEPTEHTTLVLSLRKKEHM